MEERGRKERRGRLRECKEKGVVENIHKEHLRELTILNL